MQLTYHVTKACNLRCRYCYYADFPSPRVSLETALRATDQVLALGKEHLAVTFFGGEPLLCKDLIRELVPEIQARCSARGISVNFKIPTNGLLLDEPFLDFCEQHAVFISLSLDGDAYSQADRIRLDGTNSFPQAVRALQALAERGAAFATYSVVTPRNAGRLAHSIQCLYGWGSRILITALDYSAEWMRKDLGILEREYRKLADFYVAETLAQRHFYLSAFDAKILAYTRPDTGEDTVCRIGVNQLSVAPDGTYYPCVQFVERPEFAVGDVEGGIDMEKCRELFGCSTGSDPACSGCGIVDRCSHHCACISFQNTGRLNGIPPIVCEHERVLIPIADSVARRLFRRRAPLFVNKHYNPDYDLLRTLEAVVLSGEKEAAR
jgi:uncharacterized protein